MDWRPVGDDCRRHVSLALTGTPLASLMRRARNRERHRVRPAWPRLTTKRRIVCSIECALHRKRPIEGLAHLNAGAPRRRFPMKYPTMTAMRRPQERLHRMPNSSQRATCRALVYPMPGLFLNPVALSNIKTYPMTCGWSGTAPRLFLLRSSSGTLVTMQPLMKSAQSTLARLQPAGTQARAAR